MNQLHKQNLIKRSNSMVKPLFSILNDKAIIHYKFKNKQSEDDVYIK